MKKVLFIFGTLILVLTVIPILILLGTWAIVSWVTIGFLIMIIWVSLLESPNFPWIILKKIAFGPIKKYRNFFFWYANLGRKLI